MAPLSGGGLGGEAILVDWEETRKDLRLCVGEELARLSMTGVGETRLLAGDFEADQAGHSLPTTIPG